MVDLAASFKKGPVLLREIAKCEKISKKYLEQIVITLKIAGLINATRGAKGGYYLTKSPEEIRLSDIYKILEGSSAPVDCLDYPQNCDLVGACKTREVWSDLRKAIENTFKNKTLADLAKDRK